MFYSYDKVFSYNAMLNFIIGERGVGKSYGIKKYVVSHFKKKHKQFVYLRRYKTEIKEALMKDKLPVFFDQIKNEFPTDNLSNSNKTLLINGDVARLCYASLYCKYS